MLNKIKCFLNYHLMVLSFLLCSTAVYAQLPIRQVNCGQLEVVIVPRSFTGSNDQASCSDCCSPYACDRMEYDVYLVATQGSPANLPTNGNFQLDYDELYIVLKLNRVDAVVSAINEAQTESCILDELTYPVEISEGSFLANSGEDEVTLHISNDAGDATPYIPFSNFVSDGYLFSIIVDAFPGEEFGINCELFTYVSATDCDDQDCTSTSTAVFPAPSTTNTDINIYLGDIDCNPEEFIDLPILARSSLVGTISSLDFAVIISNDAPDGYSAPPEWYGVAGSPSITRMPFDEPNASGQYIIHFKYSAQDASIFLGSDVEIATIRIYRPPYLCQGYTIDAELVAGRIRTGSIGPIVSISCKSLELGANTTEACEVDDVPICEDFQINMSTEDDLEDCSTLKVYTTLSWDPEDFGNATALDFEQLRAILSFNMDIGISITDAELVGFSCPTSGNDPVTCPGSSCIDFSGNTVELCINVGSSITVNNNAQIVVTFDAPTGCVQSALIRKIMLKLDGGSVCQPDINPPSTFPYCSPMMENFIQGDIATELDCWIESVYVNFEAEEESSTCDVLNLLTGSVVGQECQPFTSGCLCDIATADAYTVTPSKNDSPLNGVTVYDLVLISQHTIGIAPTLNSPYKMIAADANKSNTVTNTDIVELRKLILGIYSSLPANTSWRFIDRTYLFDQLNEDGNIFNDGPFPDFIIVSSLPETEADFIGIKIGDVNNTAVVNCTTCEAFERPAGALSVKEPRREFLKKGDYYTFPVLAPDEQALIAWQAAFKFDASSLELLGPSAGSVPVSADNFNLAQVGEGIIRALWFAQADVAEGETLKPGQPMFYLTFKAKKDLAENARLIEIDDKIMPNLAYTKEGTAYSLEASVADFRTENAPIASNTRVLCRPNPSSDKVAFDIVSLPDSKRLRFTVFDAFGRRIWSQDMKNVSGDMELNPPEAATWPKGVYLWELKYDHAKTSGTFIRQ